MLINWCLAERYGSLAAVWLKNKIAALDWQQGQYRRERLTTSSTAVLRNSLAEDRGCNTLAYADPRTQ